MQPDPNTAGQIAVDPSALIRHNQAIGNALIGQLANDLAITRALLDECQTEKLRLERVNAELSSRLDAHKASTLANDYQSQG